MGTAIITENIGAGLYKIRPQFDMTALEIELAKLKEIETTYLSLVSEAIDTRDQLQNDTIIAADTVNAIIQQWQDDLIRRFQEQPDNLEPEDPIDPITGKPWDDTDRAQEPPLLDAINAARTSASVGVVSRDDKLDGACLGHLRYQRYTGQIGHIGIYGSKPRDRAAFEGYCNPTQLIEELAYGQTTPEAACASMLKNSSGEMLDDNLTKAGVAFVYAPAHIGSYLWAVIMASDEGPTYTVTINPDPAKKAADETEQALDGIPKPEQDTLKPEKLGEAVKAFGLAKQKYLAAQNEVERLMAEKLIRDKRIADLEELKTSLENLTPIDCWCCTYTYDLAIGATVKTMEVPGWYLEDGIGKSSTLYAGYESQRTVNWEERSINIAARGTGTEPSYGKLKKSDSMTDASVAYNYALEPGHLKWKPIWRYGFITSISGNICTVQLTEINARLLAGEKRRSYGYGSNELPLNETSELTNVPIIYPPCNGNVFVIGDEVVIEFAGFDLTKPAVVGFRREPVACPPIRVSWEQIQ